jgi:D-alanyl-D-alanine carboxypeptidase
MSAISTSAAATGRPFPSLPGAALPAQQAAALQKELDRWVESGLLPGVTAAVASPAGTWSGAAGVDGRGNRLEPHSGMALASVSKTFTAAEVMLLAEQGKVDLDAPASTYLSLRQVANGVTIRQLLAHRSAIPDPGDKPYASLLTDLGADWSVQQFLAPVPAATAKPGQTYHYDNTNYVLLGLVIEKVTGRDVATAISADLWKPLGLSRLAYQDQQRLAPPLARPGQDDQVPNGIPEGPYLPFRSLASAIGAAGAVAGDADSAARWGYALYGGHVLSEESLAQMTDFRDSEIYGLGTVDFTAGRFSRWNIDAVGHDGVSIGYRSVLAVFETDQVSVALLTPSTTLIGPYIQYLMKAGGLLR